MKKIVFLLALVLLFTACTPTTDGGNSNNGNGNTNNWGQPIYSGVTNHPEGASWNIYQTTTSVNGSSASQIIYLQTLNTDVFLFILQKINIAEMETYSVSTSVSRSGGEYNPNEWDDLSINTHNSRIDLIPTLATASSSSGVYNFMFTASYEADIQPLIDATELKVEYIKTGDELKNIKYTLPLEFRTAMNTYF